MSNGYIQKILSDHKNCHEDHISAYDVAMAEEELKRITSAEHPDGTLAVKEGDGWTKLDDGLSTDCDGDLVLAKGYGVWVIIRNRSVLIQHEADGIAISIFEVGKENDDPVLDGMVHELDDDEEE